MYYIFLHVKHALQVVFEHVIKKKLVKDNSKERKAISHNLIYLKTVL